MANDNREKTPVSHSADADIILQKLSKYIEPATIATLFLSSVYYIGWNYNAAFFREIGINISWLEFSPDFYIRQFFLPILITIAIFYLLFQIGREVGTSRKKLIQGNLLLIVFGFICMFLGYQEDTVVRYSFFLIGISMLLATILLIQQKVSIVQLAQSQSLARLLLLVLFFGLLAIGADVLGRHDGKLIAQGRITDPVYIQFVWNEKPPENIKDKTLIFLIRNKDQNYVLVKEELEGTGQARFPKVYVVQDSQIQLRIMQTVR